MTSWPTTRAVAGVALRHIQVPDDFAAMNRIANARRAADGNSWVTSVEQFASFYANLVNCDLATDVLIAERDGQMVGYGRTEWRDLLTGERIYEPIAFAHPDEPPAVLALIHDAAEARCREIAAAEPLDRHRTLRLEVDDTAGDRVELLSERDYTPVRWFYEMIRPDLDDLPDAALPAGLEIRPVQPDQLRAIFDAEMEALQDHWGASEVTEEDYRQFVSDPVTGRYGLWRVAWDGDDVAGMVRGFINEAENERYERRRGWVEHISTRRPWRRRGLARALIAATITALREEGMTEGALGVDADNPSGALRLYESCGFVVEHRATVYAKPLVL